MQVWVNIYDPTYTVMVANRLRPIRASYKRKLDEAGLGRATFAIDPRALAEVSVRRVAEVWLSDVKLEWDGSNFHNVPYSRKLGAFVIESVTPDAMARTITVRGPGFMSKLIDKITLPGLAYDNQSVASVLSDLAGLAGWTVSSEVALSSQNISVRFAGENVLRAVRFIAEAQGLHIRESDTAKEFEAGAFGDVNSHALFVKGDSGEMALRRDAPMMIKSANITEESADVVNKVFAYGGGDGDAALSMELASSSRGFVDSEGANGRTHWFVADSASRSLYGEIARRLDIKRINPTEASDTALTFASVGVADAAKAWLDRHSLPYERLGLQVENVNDVINPGDKVHVTYQDVINLYGVPYQERDIDTPYFVMSVEEGVSEAGLEVKLEVANVDRYMNSAAEIVVGLVDSVEIQNVNLQPYPAPYYFPAGIAPIDTTTGYESSFIVNTQAVRLNSAKVFIFRSSWTAIASSAASGGGSSVSSASGGGSSVSSASGGGSSVSSASGGGSSPTSAGGGDHRHLMFETKGTWITPIGSYGGRVMDAVDGAISSHTVIMPNAGDDDMYTAGSSGTHTHDVTIPSHTHDVTIPSHTHDVTIPSHTHDAEFTEVTVDDGENLLEDVTLKIDGVAVSTGLFPDGNTDDYAEVDITDALLAGTLRGVHSIEVECAEGRGDIYCVLFIDIDVSRVRVS